MGVDSDENSDEQSEPKSKQPEDTSQYVRRSLRSRKKLDRFWFPIVNNILFTNEGEPENYKEVLNHADSER